MGNLTNLRVLWLGGNQLSGELPSSLGNLTNLQELDLRDMQLCAPPDAAFQAWLQGIGTKGGVRNCEDGGGVADDHSNTSAGATRLPLGSSRAGQIEPGGDVDYFSVQVDAAGVLTIYTTGSLDTKGVLQDGSGSTLASDDDGGDGYNFHLERSVSAGTYYIKVEAFASSSTGSYTIHASHVRDRSVGGTPTDRAVLVALYEATNGANWTNNTNWLSDRPLSEWFGVRTDANGRVTHLELVDNGLSGSLPSSLGNLTNLQELGLRFNQLSGSPPSSLGNLTNLQELWLGYNQFSGSPPSSLGNLTNLQRLDLSWNQFSGSPPSSLGNLTNLQRLDLSWNQFSGALPTWLGNLTNLQVLYLAHNNFSGTLPSSLVNLTNLMELALNNTQLCAPTDAGFQAWLQGIATKHGVVNCSEGDDDAIRFVEGVAIEALKLPAAPEGAGTPPYTYSVSGLPAGLSFDPETRTLSGAPTAAGRYEVTYTVTDATGASASLPLIVIVEPSSG